MQTLMSKEHIYLLMLHHRKFSILLSQHGKPASKKELAKQNIAEKKGFL
jgi:hypothetical protein